MGGSHHKVEHNREGATSIYSQGVLSFQKSRERGDLFVWNLNKTASNKESQ